jgi:hypothetical protein
MDTLYSGEEISAEDGRADSCSSEKDSRAHVDLALLQRPNESLEVHRASAVVARERRERSKLALIDLNGRKRRISRRSRPVRTEQTHLDETGGSYAGAVEEGRVLEASRLFDADVKVALWKMRRRSAITEVERAEPKTHVHVADEEPSVWPRMRNVSRREQGAIRGKEMSTCVLLLMVLRRARSITTRGEA